MTTEEQRAELLEQAERHERELARAVEDLKGAVRRPFAVATRMREQLGAHPLPWMLSALLIGVWLGSRRGGQED